MALTQVPVGQRLSQVALREKKGQDEWQPLGGCLASAHWAKVATQSRAARHWGISSLVSWDLCRVGNFGEGAGMVMLKVETQ